MVDAVGRKGGLAMLWMRDYEVDIRSSSANHVDTFVKIKGIDCIRFTGFYGFSKLNQRHLSWYLHRNIGGRVNEEWIVRMYFNEVLDDSEKCGSHHKSRVAIDNFRMEVDDLALVDFKPDRRRYT